MILHTLCRQVYSLLLIFTLLPAGTLAGSPAGNLAGNPAINAAFTDNPADLVVINSELLTVDENFTVAEAAAIRDGRFIAVGTNAEIEALIGPQTKVIDAGGRTVIPGLIESHVHATGAARNEASNPFIQLGSISEMQQWLREAVRRSPDGEWIRIPRAEVTRLRERRIPTRAELDEAAPEHPAAFIWQYADRQIQVLNTAAIKEAGITAETNPPDGGEIRLGPDGEPTGVLIDSGSLTEDRLRTPELSAEEYLDRLEELLRIYTRLGITSINERNSDPEGVRAYRELQAQGRLPLRTTVTLRLATDGSVQATRDAISRFPLRYGEGDDRVRVGPLKVRVDGGILYGTAYMRDAYGEKAAPFYGFDDPSFRGTPFYTHEELVRIISTGHRLGWQLSAHVTGDGGVDLVLDALEEALREFPTPDHRFTLIHAYFPDPETARRAAELGVAVDTQPAWYYKDGDALSGILGKERFERFIGINEWQRAGVKTALNSDHMIGFDPVLSLNPFHPFLTIRTAVTRKTESGAQFGQHQSISREDALRMMTVEAAWLSRDEERKGSIEPGKLADFAILSDDYLRIDETEIDRIRSLLTVVGGEIVHNELQMENR